MTRPFPLLLPVTLLCYAACVSPIPSEPRRVAPRLDRSALGAVERRGYDLYLKDIAAWRATDAVSKQTLARLGARGWISVPWQAGWRVRFIGADELVLADVDLDVTQPRTPAVAIHGEPRTLNSEQAAMWAARRRALAADFRRCSTHYNAAVLPSEKPSAGWDVFLLAASQEPGVVVHGGHHLVRISRDGRELLELRPLTKSCFVRRLESNVVALWVTHITSPDPIETHVYLSHLHGLPLYVGTSSGSYVVNAGRIEFFEKREPAR